MAVNFSSCPIIFETHPRLSSSSRNRRERLDWRLSFLTDKREFACFCRWNCKSWCLGSSSLACFPPLCLWISHRPLPFFSFWVEVLQTSESPSAYPPCLVYVVYFGKFAKIWLPVKELCKNRTLNLCKIKLDAQKYSQFKLALGFLHCLPLTSHMHILNRPLTRTFLSSVLFILYSKYLGSLLLYQSVAFKAIAGMYSFSYLWKFFG